jgi:hypothetical protein
MEKMMLKVFGTFKPADTVGQSARQRVPFLDTGQPRGLRYACGAPANGDGKKLRCAPITGKTEFGRDFCGALR